MNDIDRLILCQSEIYKALDKYGCNLTVSVDKFSILVSCILMNVTDIPNSITLYPRY